MHSGEGPEPGFSEESYDNITSHMAGGCVALCIDAVTRWLSTQESVTAEEQRALLTTLSFYGAVVEKKN